MIKGVNKQFIEVNDTGSKYFERALLVVRPEFAALSHDSLRGEAGRVLGRLGEPETVRRANERRLSRRQVLKRRRITRLVYTVLICAAGITIGVLLSRLFG